MAGVQAWSRFRLSQRRLWNDPSGNKRCNTPHLMDMGYSDAESAAAMIQTRMSTVRCPLLLKIATFSLKGVRKNTFSMSAAVLADVGNDKVRNYFSLEQHSMGYRRINLGGIGFRVFLRVENVQKRNWSLPLRLRFSAWHDGVI